MGRKSNYPFQDLERGEAVLLEYPPDTHPDNWQRTVCMAAKRAGEKVGKRIRTVKSREGVWALRIE